MKKIILLAFVSLLPLSSECFSMEKEQGPFDGNKRPKKRPKIVNNLEDIPLGSTTQGFLDCVLQEEVDNETEEDSINTVFNQNVEWSQWSYPYDHLGDLLFMTEKKDRMHPLRTRGTTFYKESTSTRGQKKGKEPVRETTMVYLFDHPQLVDKRQIYPQGYDQTPDDISNDPIEQGIPPKSSSKKPIFSRNKMSILFINPGTEHPQKLPDTFCKEFEKNFIKPSDKDFKVPQLPHRIREEKKTASKAQTSTK